MDERPHNHIFYGRPRDHCVGIRPVSWSHLLMTRKKINIDMSFADVRSDSRGKVILTIYDKHKESRKAQPVYSLELDTFMASHLASQCVQGIKGVRNKVISDLDSVRGATDD